MAPPEFIRILKMKVHVTSYKDASRRIMKWSNEPAGRYVCVSNVHMCMEAFDHPSFCAIVNGADLVVPDGKPLVWVQHLLAPRRASQVRGSDLLLKLCTEAEKHQTPIGLYGGTKKSLNALISFLKNRFPGLTIAFSSAPPFRELTQAEVETHVKNIRESGTNILFVGIGCPKQEIWMSRMKADLQCVMIGVGAAFDFFSGQKKHAPRWMQQVGLEWLFRFFSDPARLWKRYLKHNPRFLYYVLKQLLY